MADSVCPQCGGTGWRIEERDGIAGAVRCECRDIDRTKETEAKARIPKNYENASLSNFVLPGDNPMAHAALANVVVTVRSYTREFPAIDKPGLLFVGDPGTGKTHLAVAALRVLMTRGFPGLFYNYQTLLENIRSGYDPNSNSSHREAYQSALDAEILLLDDLGAHRVTDWVEDTVTSIVTHRCNYRKPLIATTNLPDLDTTTPVFDRTTGETSRVKVTLGERIGARAKSRLYEMCRIIRMPQVEDYRFKKSVSSSPRILQ
jgi:DNA replication protein DnaC